ncbi:MAG: cysteine--1-D-myo-inosityl 2-amino-2-deoxy-alpha-D-glucopyranoside ligase [Candidatus Nanopelagicaceae bacterium]|nr:cysteine--1-D-myo-inosityl 2-amino-2-deoxy-alpha-D-glucopyranoside ligase [Candidatus Nanopelagicaceae bacterium]
MLSWPDAYMPPALAGIKHPTLQLFDSYKGKKVDILGEQSSIYICGITPYDATHMGHAATYLTFDLVNRYLKASGKNVSFVENITDIDDPLLERATRDNQDWRELAESQIELFREDMTSLGVLPPNAYRGVIESMDEIISTVAEMIATGKSYQLEGDIYLDLNQVDGAIENLPIALEQALKIFEERGGDPARAGKRHALDPLLWKARKGDDPFWEAPFGQGRPGWHIECTAIALKNLPKASSTSITLQAGGSDLIFPHHYMTALQAKALTGVEFASCYSHSGMIGLDGEKMSKSKGNLVFVSKLRQEGVSPALIRIALFANRYSTDRMWSRELVDEANKLLTRLLSALSRQEVAPTFEVVQEIVNAISDDLNTPKVFDLLNTWSLKTEEGQVGGSPGEISRALDTYLGITL